MKLSKLAMGKSSKDTSQKNRIRNLPDNVSLKELGIALHRILIKKGSGSKPLNPLKIPSKWGLMLQSPVNKMVRTTRGLFSFSENGKFNEIERNKTSSALSKWLRLKHHPHGDELKKALNQWLKTGTVSNEEFFNLIIAKLDKQNIQNEDLYGSEICRLVRKDQLRYDPNYQAVYQLTPAQSLLVDGEVEQDDLKRLRRNQRLYWAISETFQSLIAMFDSDLGRKYKKGQNQNITKEFIRIKESSNSAVTPQELNKFSPLRYWAPVPSFTKSVFHMLFWKPMITKRDLYNRLIPGDSPEERAKQYYVIVNYFNAAIYRISQYASLFKALLVIARKIENSKEQKNEYWKKIDDIKLKRKDANAAQLLFPLIFPYNKMDHVPNAKIYIPIEEFEEKQWELVEQYAQNDPPRVSDFLKMLRDRMLELIAWSKFQMEIRSVGMVPVQHLYRIKIKGKTKRVINELSKMFEDAQGDEDKMVETYKKINQDLLSMLDDRKAPLERDVDLKKIYDYRNRKSISRTSKLVKWLDSSREKVVKN